MFFRIGFRYLWLFVLYMTCLGFASMPSFADTPSFRDFSVDVVERSAPVESSAQSIEEPLSAFEALSDPLPEPEPALEPANSGYSLGPGDQIKVVVYGEPELSGSYALSESGAVSLPLIGQVMLSGAHALEAERRIAGAYQEGFLVNPSVSVAIEFRRPFYILGEVRKPGSYPYVDNITVLQAVALAGGFTYRARQGYMTLKSPDGGKHEIKPEAQITPGDVVIINERFF